MKTSKRKTRSDKFPLTLHPTGQYCKKIKGKLRYFGTDKKRALESYLAQATFLHGTQSLMQKASNDKMTLRQLAEGLCVPSLYNPIALFSGCRPKSLRRAH